MSSNCYRNNAWFQNALNPMGKIANSSEAYIYNELAKLVTYSTGAVRLFAKMEKSLI